MADVTQPFHFGPDDRRLFGLFHPRERTATPRGGVLLALPFGHEAIRVHRLYRVLAERLARIGHDVLRFDYHGTGDAPGDDASVSLAGWALDIGQADAALAARAGTPVAAWIGARLGATAALRASTQRALILWDPVVDGRACLDAMRAGHVAALEASYSVTDRRWREALAAPCPPVIEAIGFQVPERLVGELHALEPPSLRAAPDCAVRVVGGPGNRAVREWAARSDPPIPVASLHRDFDWASEDSLQTALVPGDVLAVLLGAVDGPRRV